LTAILWVVEDEQLVRLSQQTVGADDPGEALRAAAQLRTQLEDLVLDRVEQAVEEGWSWSEIAAALGISKQAAHKRYAERLRRVRNLARRRTRRDASTSSAQDNIVVTAEARRVVRAAQIAALALGHDEVEGAHLILALLADRDAAPATALSELGIEFDRARDHVAALDLPHGRFSSQELNASVAGHIPMSGAAREAFKQSLREATRMGHRHLGPEHILLGLLRDHNGTAVTVLGALGVSSDDLERCLGKLLKHWKLDGHGAKPAEHPQITSTAAAG
jgi:predicted transcriptional regulator